VTGNGCVDVHAHLVPAGLLSDLADGSVTVTGVRVERHEETFRVAFDDGPWTRPVNPGLTDVDRRLAWMDDNGIGTQLVGGWLDIFGYDLAPEAGATWAEMLTAAIAQEVAAQPRLVALGTVPLQDPARAADAVRKQRADGLVGIMIATRAGDRELDDPEFDPFWTAVDETESVVFLHPGFGGASPRYRDFGLINGLARLEDTTVTLARMLYAGIPARYPNAKIIVAHGGAALPYVLGRLLRNHQLHPDTADPLESFRRLYFDTVLFDPDALRYLVDKAGSDKVLLGSDYPFPIGDLSPRTAVSEAFDGPHRERIESGNAAGMLR
jgi:aminocarboxymuconate-semialdehyde decarboxylase